MLLMLFHMSLYRIYQFIGESLAQIAQGMLLQIRNMAVIMLKSIPKNNSAEWEKNHLKL